MKQFWWEKIIEEKKTIRDEYFDQFIRVLKVAKRDGYSIEEIGALLMGAANCRGGNPELLPLKIYWLNKYWGDV